MVEHLSFLPRDETLAQECLDPGFFTVEFECASAQALQQPAVLSFYLSRVSVLGASSSGLEIPQNNIHEVHAAGEPTGYELENQ